MSFLVDTILRAAKANRDVENANIFQMSRDFFYGVSSSVVSAAEHIGAILSMAFRAWCSEWVFHVLLQTEQTVVIYWFLFLL